MYVHSSSSILHLFYCWRRSHPACGWPPRGRLPYNPRRPAGLFPRAHNAARGVDDRAEAVVVKRIGDVLRSRTLRAVARHEEVALRQQFAHDLLFFRIGRADDCADLIIATRGIKPFAPLRDHLGHAGVKRLALHIAVLQLARGRVGGLNEYEQALVALAALFQERLDAVRAQIAVDGHAVAAVGRDSRCRPHGSCRGRLRRMRSQLRQCRCA